MNPKTHDYSKRYWGHGYTFKPIDDGLKGEMFGWGLGLEKGDYIILLNGDETTRYRIDSIVYEKDPRDMWKAKVSFDPRIKNA